MLLIVETNSMKNCQEIFFTHKLVLQSYQMVIKWRFSRKCYRTNIEGVSNSLQFLASRRNAESIGGTSRGGNRTRDLLVETERHYTERGRSPKGYKDKSLLSSGL